MRFRSAAIALTLVLGAVVAGAQEYNGPPPPKADVPYLLHAENLVETEHAVARTEDRKKRTAYVISGATSPVRTPLAEPIFILLSDKIPPQNMQLYQMTINKKTGDRETVFPKKQGRHTPRPKHLTFKRINDNVYWIEVNEVLENGQYCLTPKGVDDVFCFEIY